MAIRLRNLVSIALIMAIVLVGLVVAAVYYYYTARVTVSVETPKIQWITGTDISASIGTNTTWCQISLSKLEPNATTVYTNALEFTVLSSAPTNMKLEIASVADANTIIWGIRFYVYQSGASSSTLSLVDGGSVSVTGTNGNTPVDQVGYRQPGASSSYGSASTPADSVGFAGTSSTTYIIAIEAYGRDGILSSQTASIELRLIWF
ncbi:MAG TPA: hypothetical protein VEH86_01570 [Candidatus Acidoferrum sp.]|nr:hypothetical protein [Candidatus Acidoferrum sp.]